MGVKVSRGAKQIKCSIKKDISVEIKCVVFLLLSKTLEGKVLINLIYIKVS